MSLKKKSRIKKRTMINIKTLKDKVVVRFSRNSDGKDAMDEIKKKYGGDYRISSQEDVEEGVKWIMVKRRWEKFWCWSYFMLILILCITLAVYIYYYVVVP